MSIQIENSESMRNDIQSTSDSQEPVLDEPAVSIIKIDIYNELEYIAAMDEARQWENTESFGGLYFQGILCCKPVASRENAVRTITSAHQKLSPYITNSVDEIISKIQLPLCILQIGHFGKCCTSIHKKLLSNLPKTHNKIDTSVFQTPGNDDYVYKNRSNRNFPIPLSTSFEKKIRDKKIKLSCAIPLKDFSTSLMQVGAYLDFITFTTSVRGVRDTIDDTDLTTEKYLQLIQNHKKVLNDFYASKGRRVFNAEGYTICPVSGYEFTLEDISRDSRFAPVFSDVQLGHCAPRCDTAFTVRGFNTCFMSREGNRYIGDDDFFENVWITKMRAVIAFQDAL